jgi:tetratricopeptide (TPR) repeat protein
VVSVAAGPSWAAPEPARPPRAAKAKRAPDGRAEFERAMALFQAGDHAGARPLFEQAYTLSGRRPSTTRALAQCERALGNWSRAIELFTEYVASTPTPADAHAIRVTIGELTAQQAARLAAEEAARIAAAAPPPAPAPVPTPPPAVLVAPPTPAPAVRWAPIVGVGASALLTAGGVTLWAVGRADASAVEGAAPGTSFADVSAAADRAPVLMTTGTVVAAVGVAALGLSVYWLLSDD